MILKKKFYEHAGYLASAFKSIRITFASIIGSFFCVDKMVPKNYWRNKGDYSERFRGRHVLAVKKNGELQCNGCMLCVTNCPAECMQIEFSEPKKDFLNRPKEIKSFNIELIRCSFCGLCVEACPIDAISLSQEHVMVGEELHEWVLGIDKLKER